MGIEIHHGQTAIRLLVEVGRTGDVGVAAATHGKDALGLLFGEQRIDARDLREDVVVSLHVMLRGADGIRADRGGHRLRASQVVIPQGKRRVVRAHVLAASLSLRDDDVELACHGRPLSCR